MNVKRILVVLPSWVGDVVMATPGLRALRGQYPDAHITCLMRPGLTSLLDGCAWCDERLTWPGGGAGRWGRMWRLMGTLRRQRFDLCVLFTNSFGTALVAWLAGARRRVGYNRDGRGILLTDRVKPKRANGKFVPLPMLDYYADLVRAAGCTKVEQRMELPVTAAEEAALDARLGAEDGRPIMVLNPGASYGVAKCWPAAYYAELADRFATRHDMRVIATCGPNEGDVADALRAAAKTPLTIFIDPPLGLGPLKALVRRAAIMVTNDTGPRHFAAALGRPVVTVFGSSDPAWTKTWHPDEREVSVSLECQPCMKRVCPLVHHNCMKLVTVDMVAAACEELLASVAGKRVSLPLSEARC